MEARDEALNYLQRLADALDPGQFTTDLVMVANPYLKVANAAMARMRERVLCAPDVDGSWQFWWPWHQPIGPVDDLQSVIGKITAVLRSVGAGQ